MKSFFAPSPASTAPPDAPQSPALPPGIGAILKMPGIGQAMGQFVASQQQIAAALMQILANQERILAMLELAQKGTTDA